METLRTRAQGTECEIMIIDYVNMKNFRSHADTRVTFGAGINVILGDNGAGKTSVLEAISFALFKDYGGSLDSLVRSGQHAMAVELAFTAHGRKYRVLRARAKGASDARLFVTEDGAEKLLQQGDSGVDKEIEEILGLDKYFFTNAMYVRQGEIAGLMISRTGVRREIIGRLLGIDALEKVWDRMRVVTDRFRERKARAEAVILAGDRIGQQLQENAAQLADVTSRKAKTSARLVDLEAELAKSEAADKALNESVKRNLEAASTHGSTKTMLQREEARLADARTQLSEVDASQKEMDALRAELKDGWKDVLDARLGAARKRASGLEEEAGALAGRIREAGELGGRLDTAKDRCPLCGSTLTEAHRSELMEEREHKAREWELKAEELGSEKARSLRDIDALESDRERMLGMERRMSELSGFISRGAATRRTVAGSEDELKDLRVKAEALARIMKDTEGAKEAYNKAKEAMRTLRIEMSPLREAFGRLQGKMQELDAARKRLEDEAKSIAEKREEFDRLAAFVSVLEEIRRLFDKAGLQKELRARSIPLIEMHMKEFFREFDFDYSDLSLDDDYEVTLFGQGVESTTEMMSGGERIAVALSMRLGIARALAGGSAESMLLDEPTIFLDSQRRQDLIAVLKKLTMMPQLIVVTHDPGMEEAADKITIIRKERGISRTDESQAPS